MSKPLALVFALACFNVSFVPFSSAQSVTISNEPIPFAQGKAARPVTIEETTIEEKSLDYDSRINVPPDPAGDASNGAKFYAFTLAPKEKLSVRLKSDDPSHLAMMAVRPVVVDKMRCQYERSDRVPRQIRSSRFDIQNITDGPYTLILMVHGRVNCAYKLTIERKP